MSETAPSHVAWSDEQLAEMDQNVATISSTLGPFHEQTMAARFTAERARVAESKARWMRRNS